MSSVQTTQDSGNMADGSGASYEPPYDNPAQDAAPTPSSASSVDDPEEDEDLWALVVPTRNGPKWSERDCSGRMKTALILLTKLCVLLGLLYLFVCSLGMLSDAFRLLGGKTASAAFRNNDILSNPIANLMMGVLVTVLLQSSSTTTSIVVSMVAASLLEVRPAIFIIMGANIGTSVTNTIVSLGQCVDRNEFRKAFGGATVHDMFNWLSVLILLPIEWISGSFGSWKNCGILCQVTNAMTQDLEIDPNKAAKQEILKVITKPLTDKIIKLDKDVLIKLAIDDSYDNVTLLKQCKQTVQKAVPAMYTSNATDNCSCGIEYVEYTEAAKCGYLFEGLADTWSDAAMGGLLLFIALTVLMVCLILIVKLLHSLLHGTVAIVIQKVINSDFPHPFGFLTGYVVMLVGTGLTMILQSSSIFTSTVTPLVGAGVLHLDRMYPLTLGANIGTTFTAILAALASSRDKLRVTLQVALCHLFFNVIGIIIWYPVPAMRKIPISLAKKLGNKTAKHRWFAFVYIAVMFFLFPAGVFGITLAGWKVAVGVLVPAFLFGVIIVVMCILQKKKPEVLPKKLRTWDSLPLWCHSLKPYDKGMGKIASAFKSCGTCGCCRAHKEAEIEDGKKRSMSLQNGMNNLGYIGEEPLKTAL